MKFIKKLLAIIAIIIMIICLIMACIATAGTGAAAIAPAFGFTSSIGILNVSLSAGVWLAMGIGALAVAYMIDEETASKVVDGVGGAIKDVIENVGDIMAAGTKSIFGIIPWWLWLAAGVGVFFYFSNERVKHTADELITFNVKSSKDGDLETSDANSQILDKQKGIGTDQSDILSERSVLSGMEEHYEGR